MRHRDEERDRESRNTKRALAGLGLLVLLCFVAWSAFIWWLAEMGTDFVIQ